MNSFRNACLYYGCGVLICIVQAVALGPTFMDGLLIGWGMLAMRAEWYRIKWLEAEGLSNE